MKSAILISLSAFSIATLAADFSAYNAGPGVEPELKDFLSTYFPFSEDSSSTDAWTNWWDPEGSITYRSREYKGDAARLALKQALLPSAVITWNHIVGNVTVSAETATSKIYSESVTVDIANTTSGLCGGYQGQVIAEIKKTASGAVNLTLHGANYLTYVLDLPTTPNAACK